MGINIPMFILKANHPSFNSGAFMGQKDQWRQFSPKIPQKRSFLKVAIPALLSDRAQREGRRP
jgi:hypothetical protein